MTEQSYASGGETTTSAQGTPVSPQVNPKISYSLVLPLVVGHGNQEAGAMLVYRAISQYRQNTLRNLLQNHGADDHSSAVEDLRDLELLEDYSLELVGALQTAARVNYQAYQQAANPAEYEQSRQEWEERDEVRYNEYFKAYRR
ncbi:hypothetical protein M0L20_14775 [Spirosoma sp. RP8]|uniref:Uncharacterized protein n=1 Tax=Spirosoma liriopis TaxID=2937440 RepID=A0ABT0HLT1_9BACT|nr:hypothetical protein [Spirosoma liriopis]MCK8493131.1 hypothetical protein [Spirosoma liriopis]